jgi:hypothetical protein
MSANIKCEPRKCKYEPRYDEVPNTALIEILKFGGSVSGQGPAALVLRKYVADVCAYCGNLIERSEQR